MDHGFGETHQSPPNKNISGTLPAAHPPVTSAAAGFNHDVQFHPCGYVLREARPGRPARFCDAPAMPGSSYCARHRALCQVSPDSAAAAPIRSALDHAAERTAPPPPRLDAVALPEPYEEDEDALAELDLPHAGWEE